MLPLLFQPLRDCLYSIQELLPGLWIRGRPVTRKPSIFGSISNMSPPAAMSRPIISTAMMEAVHDNAIREATKDYLKSASTRAAVAFMGGHDLPRNHPVYAKVAFLAANWRAADFSQLAVAVRGQWRQPISEPCTNTQLGLR